MHEGSDTNALTADVGSTLCNCSEASVASSNARDQVRTPSMESEFE
jgi:hypothetical protein